MLIDNYIQRQIGEYEALNHRASAALDLLEQHQGADHRLMEDAGRVLTNHHAARIKRMQNQIAYHLRSRPDLLDNIDQYNENNVGRLFQIQATRLPATGDLITRALEQRHTPAECDHVALLIMSVANLQAMTQINAEILSRDNEDNLTRAYQDVLFTLLQDTEHSQIQRDFEPMGAGRMSTLGVEELAKMADHATEQAREMASAQQTRETVAIADLLERAKQYANPSIPTHAQTRFPLRDLTDPEVAATADGARVLTTELRKLGMKSLSDTDHMAANAAHLVAEQFAEDFQLTFKHRMLPQEFDDPEERVLTPRRYTRAIKPAADLDQATEEIRQLPLGQGHDQYTHDMMVPGSRPIGPHRGPAVARPSHTQRKAAAGTPTPQPRDRVMGSREHDTPDSRRTAHSAKQPPAALGKSPSSSRRIRQPRRRHLHRDAAARVP